MCKLDKAAFQIPYVSYANVASNLRISNSHILNNQTKGIICVYLLLNIKKVINIQKQIEYWINGAIDDLESAKILVERKRFLHGLFFCHLVIEKSIKAHVVKFTSEVAPRSHNLLYLLEKTDLELSENEEIFLGILMKYQLQGRYPDYNPNLPELIIVENYLEQTEKLLLWLKKKL